MFASTVLNYMDRQTITLVERQISESFSIPNFTDFGWILAAFSMTYALFQVPAGYLVDRWDLRWTYAAAVAWWSLAAMATAIVPSLGWLFVCRALLGVGESFNWPCALASHRARASARGPQPGKRHLQFRGGRGRCADADRGDCPEPEVGLARDFPGDRLARFCLGRGLDLPGSRPAQRDARQARRREGRRTIGRLEDGRCCRRRPESRSRSSGSRRSPRPFSAVLVRPGGCLARDRAGDARAARRRRRSCLASELGGLGWATSLHEIARLRRFWILVVVSISINICWHFLINWIPTYLQDERDCSADRPAAT